METLNGGDCLYIPFHWFHQIESTPQRSISLSYWFYPRKMPDFNCQPIFDPLSTVSTKTSEEIANIRNALAQAVNDGNLRQNDFAEIFLPLLLPKLWSPPKEDLANLYQELEDFFHTFVDLNLDGLANGEEILRLGDTAILSMIHFSQRLFDVNYDLHCSQIFEPEPLQSNGHESNIKAKAMEL